MLSKRMIRYILDIRKTHYARPGQQHRHQHSTETSAATLSTTVKESSTKDDKTANTLPKTSRQKPIMKTFVNLLHFVEEATHMDQVRAAQAAVMGVKDQLEQSGNRKRQILLELANVRKNLQRIQSDISGTPRGSARYVELATIEMRCHQQEQEKQSEFSDADELERRLFHQLTTAINDSYEKEKVHANVLRTLGLIGTTIAAVFTLLTSGFGYYHHNKKISFLIETFKDDINRTLISELGMLQEAFNKDLREVLLEKKLEKSEKSIESWGGYIKRHSSNIYRFFWPK